MLGAVATATAPAATIMVINQYKAKGPLTSLLLPIVALDDAVGLVVFAISFGVAKTMISGSFSLLSVILNPLLEIVCSLGLGVLVGGLFSLVAKLFHSNSKRLSVAVTFVILSTALSKVQIPLGGEIVIGFSPLLVCMMVGTVFCNVCDFSEEIMFKTDRWTAPLYILFFVLSGAELDLRVFGELAVVGIGVAYILSRSMGKIAGASAASKLMKCEAKVCKYLGITLLPQAGVALGMSVTVAAQMGAEGEIIRDIILFSVLIYELFGPILTKVALTKAGEIQPKPDQRDMAPGQRQITSRRGMSQCTVARHPRPIFADVVPPRRAQPSRDSSSSLDMERMLCPSPPAMTSMRADFFSWSSRIFSSMVSLAMSLYT